MRVRELTSADFLPYYRMTADAFAGRVQESQPRPFSPGQIPLGVDSAQLPGGADGVLAAGARIRRDRITLGGGVASCGGIGGLAVHPAHRGGGLFRELLTAVIARCDAEGMALSMLYPSNPEIYRRLGYQVVATAGTLIVPLVDLQRLRPRPDRLLEPVTEASVPRLHRLYRELTAEDNAMLLREGPLFPAGLPADPWRALLLTDRDGRDHGYISWSRASGPDDAVGIEVHEIFGRTREDRSELLRSLGSWSTVTELARLRVRTDDPVLDVLPGGRLRPDPGVLPLVMMRVIDTAAALEARPAPEGLTGAIRLVVEDETVPPGTCRSAGAWVVSADGRRIATRPDTDPGAPAGPEPDGQVRLDVHAASLLLTGGRRLDEARRAGLTALADPAAARFLDALLAGPRPSVLDSF